MHLKEIWRYPVKSMRGEPMPWALVSFSGIEHDRAIAVVAAGGKILTARKYPKLLGLRAQVDAAGRTTVNGHPWDSDAVRVLVEEAAGPGAALSSTASRRFDVLPLLILTDGAIAALGEDHRRLRPNLVIGGVDGLDERTWEGRKLRIGDIKVVCPQLRARCVMTTYHPDTLEHDRSVLDRLVRDYQGTFALDTDVLKPGTVRVGDAVTLL